MPRSRSRSRSRGRERRRRSSRSRSPPRRSRSRDRDRAPPRDRSRGREKEGREASRGGGGGAEDASPPRRQRPPRREEDGEGRAPRPPSRREAAGGGGEGGGGARRDHRTSAFGEGKGPDKPFQQEARYDWGKPSEEKKEGEEAPLVVDRANFGLTGALAKDTRTGNIYKGVALKWSEPEDARRPERGWRLYVFKGGEVKDTLHLHRQSAYLIGRHEVADLRVEHPSCSKQHAVIQFRERAVPAATEGQSKRVVKPYIMDLESVNKTKLNGEALPPARYVELRPQDTIQFGLSTREYVLMHENMVG